MPYRGFRNSAAGSVDLRIGKINGCSKTLTKISGTEENHINARQRANLIQLGKRFRILDLNDDKSFLIGLSDIIGCVHKAVFSIRIAAVFNAIPALTALSGSVQYEMPATNKATARIIYNRNALVSRVSETGYFDARITGLNAGSTVESGYYAASAVGSETLHYVIVVLGAAEVDGKNLAYTYTSKLAGYALSRFGYIEVIKASGAVCELPVTLSSTADYVTLVPASSLTLYLPLSTDVDTELTKTVRLEHESLEAPVEAGTVVGVYSVSRGGELLGSVDLVTKNALPRSEFLVVLRSIEDFTTGVFFLSTVCAAVVLTLVYFLVRALLRRRAGRRSVPRHYRSR